MTARDDPKANPTVDPAEPLVDQTTETEERRSFLAKSGMLLAAVGVAAAQPAAAEAQGASTAYQGLKDRHDPEMFGRKVKFVVLPVEAVRTLNIRTSEQVIEAQKRVDGEMIRALEEMVNAAKAGKLEGRAVLAMGAAAW